ncbi:hypothetical protein ACAW74_18135 [Fibrella sp. WM1]|uniref:hypothetical protein n=1 Tax=Fibrella musci TaxID=3242485 RepID=UPI0035225A70
MPVKRQSAARAGVLKQLGDHVMKNGMTTMFGLCTGLPTAIDGYQSKDWHKVGQGVSEVLLGMGCSDRFGIKKKDASDA